MSRFNGGAEDMDGRNGLGSRKFTEGVDLTQDVVGTGLKRGLSVPGTTPWASCWPLGDLGKLGDGGLAGANRDAEERFAGIAERCAVFAESRRLL